MAVYCSACGTKGIEGAKFCHMCGTKLVTPGDLNALNNQTTTANAGNYNPFFGGMLAASLFGSHQQQSDSSSDGGVVAGAFTGDFFSDGGGFDGGGFDGGGFGGDCGGF